MSSLARSASLASAASAAASAVARYRAASSKARADVAVVAAAAAQSAARRRAALSGAAEQVSRDLAASFGSLPGQRLKGCGGAAVQHDALVFTQAGIDAVTDQRVREPPGVRAVRQPGDQPAGLGRRQEPGYVLPGPADG
jgi:hypothetical protein